jgi:hypothetical protein
MKGEPAQRAALPRLGEYLESVLESERKREIWAWLARLTPRCRRRTFVLDLAFDPGPNGFVGDEWVPVAEHSQHSIWLVKRDPAFAIV